MLVYANSFSLSPENGVDSVIKEILTWIGRKEKVYINPDDIKNGIGDIRLRSGAIVSSISTQSTSRDIGEKLSLCIRYSHDDFSVSGRYWITEIGLSEIVDKRSVFCSILLKTEEISGSVITPIEITRPVIVKNIIERCNAAEWGIVNNKSNRITIDNVHEIINDVKREYRSYPIIFVGCGLDGNYNIDINRLSGTMIGLAKVFHLEKSEHEESILDVLSEKYYPRYGNINIIFPGRYYEAEFYCKVRIISADRDESDNEIKVSNVLAVITHDLNIRNYSKHISPDVVKQEIFRLKLRGALESARDNHEIAAYEALLNDASDLVNSKIEIIRRMEVERDEIEGEVEQKDYRISQLQIDVDSLKYQLTNIAQRELISPSYIFSDETIREAFINLYNNSCTIEQSLIVVSKLFYDRLIILDSAISSARLSDRSGSCLGTKALELLMNLSTEYWESVRGGRGDQEARAIFGKNGFASKEAESLSVDGRRRRTFRYKGNDYFMERHLKYGVKDSLAETLRIHFYWLSSESKIIIGHCGKHLDF